MSRSLVLGSLHGVRQQGGYWMARCPVPEHEDREASLSVKAGTSSLLLLSVFAGCDLDDILGAIGLTRADISLARWTEQPADEWMPGGRQRHRRLQLHRRERESPLPGPPHRGQEVLPAAAGSFRPEGLAVESRCRFAACPTGCRS